MTEPRKKVVVDCSDDEVRTKQSFANDADINVLVKRFKSGEPMPDPPGRALYGNFAAGPDYREAMNRLTAADSAFAELPSEVRLRFGNDPEKLLEFCDDPANAEEGVQLRLFEPPAMPPHVEPTPESEEVGESDPESTD